MSVQLQCAPSRDAWSCDTNRHSSFKKSPSLPCVVLKHLTHSLDITMFLCLCLALVRTYVQPLGPDGEVQ